MRSLRPPRSRDQRGAALVESAIVMAPLFLIVFGIIEFGFIFKESLTLSSAARAGVRAAAAVPQNPQFTEIAKNAAVRAGAASNFSNGDTMWVYKAQANGQPEGGTCTSNCAIYTWNGGGWNGPGGNPWNPTTQDACADNGDAVGVRIQKLHKGTSNFIKWPGAGLNLSERSVMRLEPLSTICVISVPTGL